MHASEKQLRFWQEATHRWNIKVGATRSGKTYMDYFLIPRRLKAGAGKPGLNVIMGNTRETVRRNILLPMQGIFGARRVGDMKSDGSVMMFGEKAFVLGADRVSHANRLRGSSIKYCYGDEIVTWNRDVFEMLKSRLDRPYSVFDGTCNPDSPTHWFYAFLQSGADIYRQDYCIDDNPFLDKAFVENLKREYAGTVLYDRYICGLWVAAEGALFTTYPGYTADAGVMRDGIAHIDAAYGGADYTAFTCARRRGGTIYLYGRLWAQHVDTVLDQCLEEAKRLMCAPVFCEENADKGFLAREIRARGYPARGYREYENKYVKISSYLRKWWPNVVFLEGTDKSYVAQILAYTGQGGHDDAPDGAACACRYYDARTGE